MDGAPTPAQPYVDDSSVETTVLTQLRTGKTLLKEHIWKIKAADTELCECRSIESITHFLFARKR
jgi:hypothetical protein